jgi:hypothetical protein
MRGWRGMTRAAAAVLAAGTALATMTAGTAAAAPAAPRARPTAPAGWRARTVVPLSHLAVSAAVSTQAGAAYELVSRSAGSGPYGLRRVGLASKNVTKGGEFPVSDLTLAAGYLWVSGQIVRRGDVRLVLYQVSPDSLRTVRSWRLTPFIPAGFLNVAVAGGPAGSAWVGFKRTLWRLSTRTGAVLARARLRSGLSVSDVATDPAASDLYVSAAPEPGGAVLREYRARSGRLLASASGKPLTFSVAGAQLTAAPGGVWASFRTGMAGQTVLLRQRGLRVARLTGGQGLFGWFMFNTTIYGGGSLWLGVQGGDVGCVAPATGRVRSRGTLRPLAVGDQMLAVDAARRVVYSFAGTAIMAVTAPAACWR